MADRNFSRATFGPGVGLWTCQTDIQKSGAKIWHFDLSFVCGVVSNLFQIMTLHETVCEISGCSPVV